MDSGELCVMIGLVKVMLTLFADSWDTTVHTITTNFQCKKGLLLTELLCIYIIYVRTGKFDCSLNDCQNKTPVHCMVHIENISYTG